MELISDGNITLMRAVESFDIHKGNRFSTYATLALMKGFARSVPMMQAATKCSRGDSLLREMADTRPQVEHFAHRDEVRQLLSNLNDRERTILLSHYGLNQSAPASYDQVAEQLGLSRQRVRQIEQLALAKLRRRGGRLKLFHV